MPLFGTKESAGVVMQLLALSGHCGVTQSLHSGLKAHCVSRKNAQASILVSRTIMFPQLLIKPFFFITSDTFPFTICNSHGYIFDKIDRNIVRLHLMDM